MTAPARFNAPAIAGNTVSRRRARLKHKYYPKRANLLSSPLDNDRDPLAMHARESPPRRGNFAALRDLASSPPTFPDTSIGSSPVNPPADRCDHCFTPS